MEQGNKGGNNIEAVLFDFGGVLAEEGWKQGFRAIAEANGLDGEELVQAAGDTVYATGYITGRGSESSFWQAMREQTGVRGNDAALNFEIVSRFIPREWMFKLVKRLKTEQRTVGILSDQTDILDKLNARFDFFRFFDFVFNSYHIGKGKRDRSLFDDIARLLKTEPEKILFIDDDPGNVERARQSGWQALLYIDRNSFCAAMEEMLSIKG
ncbi:putative hydrolase of the HAD superfamily [Syntrophus gentianae]|uniref:Putative hydrolase of the HAD superfamily n=1 Tax=Syntrophus gentianae TaxID=43775 RepID=A0A1H7YEP6_9BACT|nr:HAD-IA family hydrolase [Syntrophus gentianae]SEM44600.1 putative hydrolase of the HAD superfamily [Syntrophus gentianae]